MFTYNNKLQSKQVISINFIITLLHILSSPNTPHQHHSFTIPIHKSLANTHFHNQQTILYYHTLQFYSFQKYQLFYAFFFFSISKNKYHFLLYIFSIAYLFRFYSPFYSLCFIPSIQFVSTHVNCNHTSSSLLPSNPNTIFNTIAIIINASYSFIFICNNQQDSYSLCITLFNIPPCNQWMFINLTINHTSHSTTIYNQSLKCKFHFHNQLLSSYQTQFQTFIKIQRNFVLHPSFCL